MNSRRFIRIKWLVSLLVAFLTVFAFSVQAQQAGFTENFDDPSLPGWEHSDNARVDQGVLHIGAEGFAYYGNTWNNLSLAIRMRHPGSGEASVHYRESDAGSYILRIGLDHIAINLQAGDQNIELEATPNPISLEDWVEVDIIVEGDSHKIILNGKQVLSFSESSSLPPGGIGLRYSGEGLVEFDDLSVTLLGDVVQEEDNPPEEDQTPTEEQSARETATDPGVLRWVYTGGPPGGLGYDIRYKPSDPTIWYVTDAFAGVFMSTDDGHTWKPINEGIKGQRGPSGDWIPVFSLTIDPHDNDILWVGTQNTGHIYKSMDGGANWVLKDNGVSIKYHALSFRGFTVDPRSSDIVYAMAETTRNEPNPDETGGQIYKTTNGGENWELIWDGGMPSALTRYLWIHPDNPDILYVSTGIFDRGAVGGTPTKNFDSGIGVLKSTDGGKSWQQLDRTNGLELMHIGSLFMHPDDPDILLAAAGHLPGDEDFTKMEEQGYSIAGVYRTTDGGDSWQRVLEAPISRPGESFTSVEICLSDTNVAYAGSEFAIYRSGDGGQNWQLVTGGDTGWGPPGVSAGWPIDMQCDAKDPERIFANNYLGGNFLSDDGGQTWVNASQGYTGAHMLSLALAPNEPGKLFATGRPGFWVTYNGGSSWKGIRPRNTSIHPGDAGVIAIDPSNHDHLISGGRNIFGLVESWDSGQTWQDLWRLSDAGIEHFFTRDMVPAAIVFAPSNPQVIYLGGAHEAAARSHEEYHQGVGVLVSNDGGKNFTQTNDPALSQLAVYEIAVDPLDSNLAYVATSQGLFKTEDGGGSWHLLNTEGDTKWIWTIEIHPQNPDYLIAGVDKQGPQISMDGGMTWKNANIGWEINGSPSSFAFDPNDPQIVYLADYLSGAFWSQDGGFTWEKINQGLTLRNILDLAISHDGKHLYAATFGGGVFRLDLFGEAPVGSTSPPSSGVTESETEEVFKEPLDEPPKGDSQREEPLPEPIEQPGGLNSFVLWGIVLGVVIVVVVIAVRRRAFS